MGVYPLERMHWTARRQFPLGGGELALFSLHLRYWAMSPAPLPELMDRKKRDIMERKGDKEDENKRQKQQKESSAAAL